MLPSESVDNRRWMLGTLCGSADCSRTGMNSILCVVSVAGRSLEAERMILMRFPSSRSSGFVNFIAFVMRFISTIQSQLQILIHMFVYERRLGGIMTRVHRALRPALSFI